MQAWRAKLVARRIREGAVIAYPTEGVWGLGCHPEIAEAVSRILALKRRSRDQGLILVASRTEQVERYLGEVTEAERATLEQSWPGPVTFIVPDRGVAPEWIRGRHESVALRVSAHPVIRGICNELGGPIVSTSANPTGKPAAMDSLRLRQYFPGGIDLIVPGDLAGAGATQIRELRGGAVLRPSSVS